MAKHLIRHHRSVMASADVPNIGSLHRLVSAIGDVPGVSSWKFGFQVGLDGLLRAVRYVHDAVGKENTVIVYDAQKAGNDIPEMGAKFAAKLKQCDVDGVIIFPFTGPKTQREWTKACVGEGLRVLIGGMMTHEEFLVSEGGHIVDTAPERIYKDGIEQGVTDFVMPGNKLEWVKRISGWLTDGLGDDGYDSYAPGFITQKGDISECGRLIRGHFHAIVGSAIYGKDKPATHAEMRTAALECTSKLSS